MVIASVPLEEFYKVVYWYKLQSRCLFFPPHIEPRAGAVFLTSPGDLPVEIAFITDCAVEDTGWKLASGTSPEPHVMKTGCTRFSATSLAGSLCRKIRYRGPKYSWFSQANYIFNSLSIDTNESDYVFIEQVEFRVHLSRTSATPATGYLFIRPFDMEETSMQPAYWSRDANGAEELCPRRARKLGFPDLEAFVTAWGQSWDGFVYSALRQFHQGKGFNPEDESMAQHLGYPRYRLSLERNCIDRLRSAASGEDPTRFMAQHGNTGVLKVVNAVETLPLKTGFHVRIVVGV
ncbi:hypothetical protein C8F04DRAFT_457288 [Mycena alexandri]|uniref:Uncharacterized protein n=1 Tax=Mycena alexandri TaxID=1745969 RepID=A0AAD6T2X2_9AGAR|nr:hypothetical protein C8F04DRAFT_457288 [Mycena alexandri]